MLLSLDSSQLILTAALFTELLGIVQAQTYTATYLPSTAPNTTASGQFGTNACGNETSQTSLCQNAYMNAIDDFCLFAPPGPGANKTVGASEGVVVSWCTKSGYGTRLIPDGTISGAHFVQTPDYVQVTGVGNLTNINIPPGDLGGELDPHGGTGTGNPPGALVFSSAFGGMAQMHEWSNFVAANQFCFRACQDGPRAASLCDDQYDTLGCNWNMPGDYDAGVFERCIGDSGEPMGVYGTSTFYKGQPTTPPPHSAPSTSLCTTVGSIANGQAPPGAPTTTSMTSAAANTSRVIAPPGQTGSAAQHGKSLSRAWTGTVAALAIVICTVMLQL